jgi:hypothetical protein
MKAIKQILTRLELAATILLVLIAVAYADESLVLTEEGNVGIGTQDPSSKLEVADQFGNVSGQSFRVNLTLEDAVTLGNKTQEGIRVSISDSALSGSQTDGSAQAIFGIRNSIQTGNEQGGVIGNYNQIEMLNQSTTSYARGDFNYILQAEGALSNAFGEYNYVRNQQTGAITNAYGNHSYIFQEGEGQITNGYAYCAQLKRSAGTVTNSYLFYGSYSGTFGNKYGLYLSSEEKNYLSGSLGLGTNSPDYKLDVNGVIRGTNVAPSDIRWKENVQPIGNGLELIGQLRGVSYEWVDKSKGTGRQIGVIAQEVEKVFPEVVHTDSKGYKSVEYDKLIAPLIQAVNELKTQNEQMKKRISNLEAALSQK